MIRVEEERIKGDIGIDHHGDLPEPSRRGKQRRNFYGPDQQGPSEKYGMAQVGMDKYVVTVAVVTVCVVVLFMFMLVYYVLLLAFLVAVATACRP